MSEEMLSVTNVVFVIFIVVCMYVHQCIDCASVYGIYIYMCMLKLFLSFNNQYNMKRKFKNLIGMII